MLCVSAVRKDVLPKLITDNYSNYDNVSVIRVPSTDSLLQSTIHENRLTGKISR